MLSPAVVSGVIGLFPDRQTPNLLAHDTAVEGVVDEIFVSLTTAQQLKSDDTNPDSPLVEDLRLQAQELAASAQAGEMENVLREDEIKNWDEKEIEEALKDAPEKEGRFIKVKRVIE